MLSIMLSQFNVCIDDLNPARREVIRIMWYCVCEHTGKGGGGKGGSGSSEGGDSEGEDGGGEGVCGEGVGGENGGGEGGGDDEGGGEGGAAARGAAGGRCATPSGMRVLGDARAGGRARACRW